jgi:glycosyltransferase involved in cell wall biosynthesis
MPDLRVLMLATYFPKPLNPFMGNWALTQAQALQRNGIDLIVVSLTSPVPQFLAVTKGADAYAKCPLRYEWDGLTSLYPRWLYYQVGPARILNQHYPGVSGAIGWLTARRALLAAIRDFRPDLIYAHHTAVNGYLAVKLKRLTGLPFLVGDHDFDEIESCRSQPARRRVFEEVTRESAVMIAVSKRMEREMKDQFPHSRTCTIHGGTDPVPRAMSSKPRPAELRGKRIIFSCGAFYHRKGFPLLIEAFACIADKYPDAQLRIMGDGEERSIVEQRIRDHKLESRITLLGRAPLGENIQEMVWCDAFALIGWDEPLGTVYLEALSAGKPVICCSDCGITDAVEDGVHGLVVPPRDVTAAAAALDRLLGDTELRNQLGRSGLHLFETALSWDSHAQRMKKLFSQALQQNGPVPQ